MKVLKQYSCFFQSGHREKRKYSGDLFQHNTIAIWSTKEWDRLIMDGHLTNIWSLKACQNKCLATLCCNVFKGHHWRNWIQKIINGQSEPIRLISINPHVQTEYMYNEMLMDLHMYTCTGICRKEKKKEKRKERRKKKKT